MAYNWIHRFPAHAPEERVAPGLAYDVARSKTVLFGGSHLGLHGDTWIWDGTDWTELFPATSPGARSEPGMAYDQSNSVTVLFGGAIDPSGNGDQQTWTWNGTNWTQLFPANKPSARAGAALVWDDSLGKIVLWGGRTNPLTPVYNNQTWTWDGTDWTQLSPATSPTARAGPALAYHAGTSKIVLFGGNIIGTGVQDETWTFDGTTWTLESPVNSPSPRQASWISPFPTTDVILFGGLTTGAVGLGDTWAWDGTNWTEIFPVDSPPARDSSGLGAFDSGRTEAVLFGGETEPGPVPLDETWVLVREASGILHLETQD